MRNIRKQDKNELAKGSGTKAGRDDVDNELDALFRLPMPEFTGARNALAARLKKDGRGDDAARVKALVKPPISAWAVNQLYWNHRAAFDRLIASADRFHRAQAAPGGGKIADMRTALDARREALMNLSDLATSLLRDAGHNPSLDIIRRITSTLEAMSAKSDRASRSDAPRPGRLTNDVDPPGFESLASFVPGIRSVPPAIAVGPTNAKRKQTYPPAIAGRTDFTTTNKRRKVAPDNDVRKLQVTHKAKMAAAKMALQNAKRSLTQARARAQSLEAAQKKADADAKKAENLKRNAEESLEKAKAAFEGAAERARSVAIEVEEVASAVEDAERAVEKASTELDSVHQTE